LFETLFHYPGVIARHRAAPFADAREGQSSGEMGTHRSWPFKLRWRDDPALMTFLRRAL